MGPGMAILVGIGLLVIGLLLICIECMIPSFGIIGLLGSIALIAAIVLGFQSGLAGGFIFLLTAMLGTPVSIHLGFKLLPKMPFGRSFILTGPSSEKEQTVDTGHERFEGKEGVAKSVLRPSGIALIDDERVAVQTEGEIIEKNSRIKVVKVVGNTVFVEQV